MNTYVWGIGSNSYLHTLFSVLLFLILVIVLIGQYQEKHMGLIYNFSFNLFKVSPFKFEILIN